MNDLEARLEVDKDSFPAKDGAFTVEYDLRFAGELGWIPSGPAVKREKDGRRFIYIGWYGTKNGIRRRFRRLKVPLGEVGHFSEEPTIRVAGKDAKGGPACAQAKII